MSKKLSFVVAFGLLVVVLLIRGYIKSWQPLSDQETTNYLIVFYIYWKYFHDKNKD